MSLCVCAGKAGWGGGAGSAEGCEGAASPGPSTRDLGSAAVGRSNQPFGGTYGKDSKLYQLGSFLNISYKPGAREHFTWQVMTFPGTDSLRGISCSGSVPSLAWGRRCVFCWWSADLPHSRRSWPPRPGLGCPLQSLTFSDLSGKGRAADLQYLGCCNSRLHSSLDLWALFAHSEAGQFSLPFAPAAGLSLRCPGDEMMETAWWGSLRQGPIANRKWDWGTSLSQIFPKYVQEVPPMGSGAWDLINKLSM